MISSIKNQTTTTQPTSMVDDMLIMPFDTINDIDNNNEESSINNLKLKNSDTIQINTVKMEKITELTQKLNGYLNKTSATDCNGYNQKNSASTTSISTTTVKDNLNANFQNIFNNNFEIIGVSGNPKDSTTASSIGNCVTASSTVSPQIKTTPFTGVLTNKSDILVNSSSNLITTTLSSLSSNTNKQVPINNAKDCLISGKMNTNNYIVNKKTTDSNHVESPNQFFIRNCLKNALNSYNIESIESALMKQTLYLNNNKDNGEKIYYSKVSSGEVPNEEMKQNETSQKPVLKFLTTTALPTRTYFKTSVNKSNLINSPTTNNSSTTTISPTTTTTPLPNDKNTITTISGNSNNKNNSNNNNNNNTTKPVGFINLQQEGWSYNFIKTTTLKPSTIPTTYTSPIKTKVLNSNLSYNNDSTNSINNSNNKNIITIQQEQQQQQINRSLIEDVHNYSKKSKRPGDPVSTTNSSVEDSDDDDDDEDDVDDDDDYDYEIEANKIEKRRQEFNYRKFLNISSTLNKNKLQQQLQQRKLNITEQSGATKKYNNEKHQNTSYSKQKKIAENYKADYKMAQQHKQQQQQQQQQPESDLIETGNEEGNEQDQFRPEHHARRPMNAFLIFCKRHRAIVRDKYKNVENRQVTKILGEWWESMSPDEKSSYTNLAKEYKDAFLNANPNFKWYKLPAPPLRTLATRPTNSNSEFDEQMITDDNQMRSPEKVKYDNIEQIYLMEKEKEPSAAILMKRAEKQKITKLINESQLRKDTSGKVNLFKFADETQLGGLSSLLTGNRSPPSDSNSSDTIKNDNNDEEENDLQSALGETSEYMSLAMQQSQNLNEPFEKMRDHANQMMSSKCQKRKLIDDTNQYENKKFIQENSFSSGDEELRKPTRSCKGKKYQELISSGQITTSSKKMKKINLSPGGKAFSKESSYESDGPNQTTDTVKGENEQNNMNGFDSPMKNSDNSLLQSPDNSPMKPFDTNAFDLESKIMALPAQDLEDYLQKKQESKCKKKIGSKHRKTKKSGKKSNTEKKNSAAMKMKEEIEQEQIKNQQQQQIQNVKNDIIKEKACQIVGSQKRKARKESITRRDLSAIYNATAAIINNEPINTNVTTSPSTPTITKPQINWTAASVINGFNKTAGNVMNIKSAAATAAKSVDQKSENVEMKEEINSQQSYTVVPPVDQVNNNKTFELQQQLQQPMVPATSNVDLLILAEVASNFDE